MSNRSDFILLDHHKHLVDITTDKQRAYGTVEYQDIKATKLWHELGLEMSVSYAFMPGGTVRRKFRYQDNGKTVIKSYVISGKSVLTPAEQVNLVINRARKYHIELIYRQLIKDYPG